MTFELHKRVFALHQQGIAPSDIDRKLSLEAGTAHDSMVEIWHIDKYSPRENSYIVRISRL